MFAVLPSVWWDDDESCGVLLRAEAWRWIDGTGNITFWSHMNCLICLIRVTVTAAVHCEHGVRLCWSGPLCPVGGSIAIAKSLQYVTMCRHITKATEQQIRVDYCTQCLSFKKHLFIDRSSYADKARPSQKPLLLPCQSSFTALP